jgi:hypothetical protein
MAFVCCASGPTPEPEGAAIVRSRMTRAPLQRAIVLIAALLVVGWLAVSYSDSYKIENSAFVGATQSSTPAQIEAAVKDLRSAGTLNPARTDALAVEAALELRRGRQMAAAKVLEEMGRREPLAREPWFLLAQLLRTSDPRGAADARARLKRLDPIEGRRQGF